MKSGTPPLWKRISVTFRKKRMRAFEDFYFEQVMGSTPPRKVKNITVLDVGGTLDYWKTMDFKYMGTASIELLNLTKAEVPESYPNITSVAGDATDMRQYADKSFDLVFSNSVIEHVGDFDAQKRMAAEIQRIGRHYYLQTPNRYFFLEPHFLFPLFQFFPLPVKTFLIRRFKVGNMPKAEDKEDAVKIAKSIRLMTLRELKELFPEAKIGKEKFLFLTKSFYLSF